MSKIADVVKLKTGYANFVELKKAFEASQENADRMAMYRPTKSHREAFERICRGLYQPNDKKFYLLSGSYGTGKSHLCLMLANFLSRSSGDPEIAGFYENYTRLDPEKAKLLKNIRKDGQSLVAICDYHSGRKFEDVVLKAVLDAFQARGLSIEETEFDEAERQLEEWQRKGDQGGIRNFYVDFCNTLESISPGLAVEQLRAGLKDYDSNDLEIFRTVFKEMMGGIEFHAQSGNLVSIIKKLVRRKDFKERFKGLAIFFDEFGFTLEGGRYAKDVLQGFMETICHDEPNVIFVGCIHKNFEAYADRLSKDDAVVMSARLTPVDLFNEGIEEIIGAIVETDKESENWKKEVMPRAGIFDQLLPPCKSLNLFPWIDDLERIRKRVLEDIYGVHPMALSCLLKLSSEIGSDVRSAFTFFSGDVGGAKGSYADFIKDADITLSGGKLNLYTVDRLFTFFEKELSQKNTELSESQRQLVNGYYASLNALQKSAEGTLFGLEADERVNVLKTILIYQLCQIPTTLENIQFGLYCLSSDEKRRVKGFLDELVKCGALFLRQQSKTYELAVSGEEDPYELIERYVNDVDLHPPDLVKAFLEEAGGKQLSLFAEAKGYNMPFGEDKRFKTYFVRAKDLGKMFWDEIRRELTAGSKPSESFEGVLVYALCENETEVNMAREAAKNITDENVVLAVPHEPQPFTDTLLRVKACRYYLPPNEPVKISAQTESRFQDILTNAEDGYLTKLKHIFQNIEEGSEACWYGQGGQVLVDRPKQPHQPADMLCEKLFKKRCRIKHPDLNLCHDDRWLTGKNTALKQAVNVLLKAERVFIDNGNPENHGEKRYLEKVLLRGAGSLKKTETEGTVTYFNCEANPDMIHKDFPVLKELCERLAKLEPGESFSVGTFCEDVRKAPYGAGGTQIILALAHVIRAYGERLIVYQDSTKMVEQPIQSYEDLVEIVSDPSAQTVFAVRDISSTQLYFIDLVAKAVGAPPLKYGEARSLKSAFEALRSWWESLPDVAKVIDLYEKQHRERLQALKSLLDGISGGNVDHFDFILEQLPAIYLGLRMGDVFTKEDAKTISDVFTKDVKLFNSGEQIAYRELAQAVCELYGTKGDMIECEEKVNQWYRNLNPIQRDPTQCDLEEASLFIKCLDDHSSSFKEKMVEVLPKEFGFGPVSSWTSLHIEDFVAKLKQAKAEIERVKSVVNKPNVEEGMHELSQKDKIIVKIPEGASKLIYTVDGSDPWGSETCLETEDLLDVAALLEGLPNVKVKIRAVDVEGNVSDPVSLDLISKERKYEIVVGVDLFGNDVITFKCPEDTNGLLAALKSIIRYGTEKKLLSSEKANKMEALLKETD